VEEGGSGEVRGERIRGRSKEGEEGCAETRGYVLPKRARETEGARNGVEITRKTEKRKPGAQSHNDWRGLERKLE